MTMASTSKNCQESEKKGSVNLFVEPHQRLKDLVKWPLSEAAKYDDVHDLEPSLQAIYEAMWEMKSHEYIENHYIMDRLKQRLQTKRVYNELVCNCHEDSKLLDVIALVEKVYQAQTQRDRVKYGRRLQKSIRSFMQEFLEHMAEEESVFQPLLDENFDSNELKQMKEVVERQHSMFREKVKTEKSLKALKRKRATADKSNELDFTLEDLRFRKSYCQEVNDFLQGKQPEGSVNDDEVLAKKSKITTAAKGALEKTSAEKIKETKQITFKTIDDLPEEILIIIFSYLGPRSLVACGGVNVKWRNIAYFSVFWKALYPTQWARGQWSFDYIPPDLRAEDDVMSSFTNLSSVSSSLSTSLESLDESEVAAVEPVIFDLNKKSISADEKIFHGIASYLLPKVGLSVSTLILSASKSLNDKQVNMVLAQVPNVRTINLSFTLVTSEAFDGLYKHNALRKLEDLNLSGCIRIGDNLLAHLSRCFSLKKRPSSRSKLRKLSLSGCKSITSVGLEYLVVHAVTLQELDLSGCYKVDGETLTLLVKRCPRLKPERLAYCNDIEDGPYPDSANGCLNLECEIRFCCQSMIRN